MGRKFFGSIAAASFLFFWTPTTHAQTRDGTFQLSAGAGPAWHSPVRFDLDVAGEYFWKDHLSTGLDIDAFFRNTTSFGFIPFARYYFDLQRWPRFSPYVGAGMGGLVNTQGQGWFDLMLPEFGFLFELTPRFYLGPYASLHTLAGSTTTWDFQTVGQLTYQF